jgi:hypothetical protein
MRILHAAAALAMLLGLAGFAPAQSLGELAKKEKQKRQGKPAPKAITEDDLGRAGTKGTFSVTGESGAEAAPTGEVAVEAAQPEGASAEPAAEGSEPSEPAAPAAAPPGAKKEKTEEELLAERRAEWQKKLGLAREKAKVHQTNVENVQRDLNDPTAGTYTDRRVQLQKLFDSEKASLAAAQAEVEQLEEEGRRNGWPR